MANVKLPKQYNPRFQFYSENQNLFRPYIFKTYSRDASKWKKLYRLVDEYEKRDGNGQARIKLKAGELALVMKFLEKNCSKGELKVINENVERRGKQSALNEAIFVEYSKAYPRAYKKANADFMRSDYRYDFEFFAVKFGLVKTKEYTKRR